MVRESETRGDKGKRPGAGSAGPAHAARHAADIPVTTAPHVLRDYAFLGDGHRGVLVGPQGDCAWLCFPGWSDPAVFASLIGSGGQYVVQPSGRWVWGGYYEDGSLIWVSRWVTTEGILESRDALVYPGKAGRAVLLRRVRALDHRHRVVVALDPRADYGRRAVGSWHQRDSCWQVRGQGMTIRWWGADDAMLQPVDHHHRLELELSLEPAMYHDLILELIVDEDGNVSTEDEPPNADRLWRMTEDSWSNEVPDCTDVVARRDVRRSYAVLRGMTGPDGGTVAAATTSLPERADGNRNYDYRYVWVRDTCYVGRAGSALSGGERMLDDAVRWITARLLADGDKLVPAYLPDGGPVPGVSDLGLPGYPGGNDVVGNRIGDQFQLDTFGDALLLLAIAASRNRLDPSGWRAAEVAAGAIERRWKEPDSGIWEIEPREWTNSRLLCVAGLRALCETEAPPDWTAKYLALADEMMASIAAHAVHPSGRWQRAPDDPRIDASLLLGQIRGAVPDGDPRSVATRRAVVEELSDDGYVYRYATPGEPLGGSEGAFLICNFWMSLAAWDAGDEVGSVRWFERARTSAGSPGLLAEEMDVVQHQLRGNLPQAFVHAALIESAAVHGPSREHDPG